MKNKILISTIALASIVNSADAQQPNNGNKEIKNKLFYSLNNLPIGDSLARSKAIQRIVSKNSNVSNFRELGNSGYFMLELKDSTSAEKIIKQFKNNGIELKFDKILPNLACTTPLFAANDPWNDMGYWNSLNQNVLKEKQLMDSIYYLIKANFWNGAVDPGENVGLNMSEIRNGSHTDMSPYNATGSFDFYRNQAVNFANATLHGSNTAGVAASKINNGLDMVGMGNIKPVKIKNSGIDDLTSSKTAILAAMQACINEANNTGEKQILSISAGITSGVDPDFDNMFNQADASGKVLFVIGLPNDGNPIGQTLSNPHSSVITIQGGDGQGNKAPFSGYNGEVSFKGVGMRGLLGTGTSGTNSWQGNSAAAPGVAGAIRLLWSLNPNRTPAEINAMLTDTKNTRTLILNPNSTLTPAVNIGYLIQNLHFDIVHDYPGVINASTTPTINLNNSTHDIQTGTIANPTYWYQKNQTGAWLPITGGIMDLNVAGNGTHNVKIEFDIAHQPGKCTEIVRGIQVSNAITPTVPPVPTIINVDPIECQNNPTQTGKLMNPPVAPATITVTQDGNPISYNTTDSTFSYSVGTPGAHTIRAKYTNAAGSSQKDTAYTVYASASPIGDVGPNAVAQCENTAANLTFAFTNNNGVGYTHEQHIINPSGVDNVNGIVVPGTITTPILGPGVWKSYVKSTQGTNTCAPFTVYSDTATITVSAQFIADATITAPGQVCDNATINGTVTPKPGTPNNTIVKLYKQVGTGTPTVFQTTTYTGAPIAYNTTGQIPQVKIWSEIDLPAGGCYVDANGDTATVNVNAIPAPPSATITQPTCSLSTGQITINPTTGYTYSFDNGATYTSNNVSGQLASGTYQIKVKSASGCESVAVPAVINTAPTVPSAPVTTITQPTCTISTGQITITPVAGYTYSFDNGVTYGANNVSPQMAPGSYQIKVKSASGCESAPVTAIVSASPLPASPSIAQVASVLSVQSPIAGAQYQWQKKNTATGLWEDIAGATGTSYTVTTTGEYRTNIINNGCGPVASNAINAVITSIPNPTNPNGKLKMYPNPLQNGQVFTIDSLPQGATQVKIGIYDAKGVTVRLMEAQVINRKVQIQLPFMASGLYFIRIQDKRNGKWYEGSEKIVVN